MNMHSLPETGSDPRAARGFLRLAQVLELIPVSRSAWWAGCRSGRYPRPVKLGPRTTVWYRADIEALIAKPPADVPRVEIVRPAPAGRSSGRPGTTTRPRREAIK